MVRTKRNRMRWDTGMDLAMDLPRGLSAVLVSGEGNGTVLGVVDRNTQGVDVKRSCAVGVVGWLMRGA